MIHDARRADEADRPHAAGGFPISAGRLALAVSCVLLLTAALVAHARFSTRMEAASVAYSSVRGLR